MNVNQVSVTDLDVCEGTTAIIGETILSLVIAHTYLKSLSEFEGIHLTDETTAALGIAALRATDEAHEQLHDALHQMRSADLPDWIARGLSEVVADVHDVIADIARQVADEAIAQFIGEASSQSESGSTEETDSKVVQVRTIKTDDDH